MRITRWKEIGSFCLQPCAVSGAAVLVHTHLDDISVCAVILD